MSLEKVLFLLADVVQADFDCEKRRENTGRVNRRRGGHEKEEEEDGEEVALLMTMGMTMTMTKVILLFFSFFE